MHLYLYFNENLLKPCKMFVYVCMYVCMHVCINFTVKLNYPCCCFAEPPALIPLECSLNVDVEVPVELTHCPRPGMYGKALGYNLDF